MGHLQTFAPCRENAAGGAGTEVCSWTMPSSPRQCRSAPAQGRTWIFPESRTILGAESPEMRKAVSQGDGRHVGLRARTQKLVTHKLQSSLPQERGWSGLAPLAKA